MSTATTGTLGVDFDDAVLGQGLPPLAEAALCEAGAQRGDAPRAMAALMRAQTLPPREVARRGAPLPDCLAEHSALPSNQLKDGFALREPAAVRLAPRGEQSLTWFDGRARLPASKPGTSLVGTPVVAGVL